MKSNQKFNLEKQEILLGSRILKNYRTKNRIDYFYEHSEENYLVKNNILSKERFSKKFRDYRNAWNGQPDKIIDEFEKINTSENYTLNDTFKPLCLDLELASICD